MDDTQAQDMLNRFEDMIETRLVEQIKLDEIIANWRKNWRENEGVYREGVLMPPLYDEDLKTWTENRSEDIALEKVNKERLDKFYNAKLLLESIKLKEEAHERYEQYRKRYNEWRQSEEYKEMVKRLNDE
jgi:hypothetical protein